MSQTPERFTAAASEQTLQSVAHALSERNMTPLVVDTPADARRVVLEMIPDGAEVHSGKSKTLEDAGLFSELQELGPLRLSADPDVRDGSDYAGTGDSEAHLRSGLHGEQRAGDHCGRCDRGRFGERELDRPARVWRRTSDLCHRQSEGCARRRYRVLADP